MNFDKIYACTLFDANYAHLGMALYESMCLHFGDFHLWVLALDERTEEIAASAGNGNLTVVPLAKIEDKKVLAARNNRTWQEYCWTLGSVFTWYVASLEPALPHIFYLDSDICFFDSPKPIFDEISDASIMIIPHRFPERLKHFEENGKYNVEMVYFKNDAEGMRCLEEWSSDCLDWCYYKNEPDRMGDQKYLDYWPGKYRNVHILENKAAGVALWNLESYQISIRNGKVFVDASPLIFFHFHQFKLFRLGLFFTGLAAYNQNKKESLAIYRQYIYLIQAIQKKYDFQLRKIFSKEFFSYFFLGLDGLGIWEFFLFQRILQFPDFLRSLARISIRLFKVPRRTI